MKTLVLAPHGDDESLFASYICIRKRAHVIVCSHDADPEIRSKRSRETTAAIVALGCSHHEWPMLAGQIDLRQARIWLESWNNPAHTVDMPSKVYAPLPHREGHEEHNQIGELAVEVFGEEIVSHYLTYAPRGQRQRAPGDIELIPTADEIGRKLLALSAYRTQIANPSTRPWFFELLDLREWIV